MSTTVSKTLTHYLIQLYLLKDKSITPPPLMLFWEIYEFFRSSHRRYLWKKLFLENFAIFIGKLQACNFIKKRLQHRCYPLNITKFLTLFRMFFSGLLTDRGDTYPTMMKLDTVVPYLRKIQKKYESCDTLLEFCWNQHFFSGNRQILQYQEIQI